MGGAPPVVTLHRSLLTAYILELAAHSTDATFSPSIGGGGGNESPQTPSSSLSWYSLVTPVESDVDLLINPAQRDSVLYGVQIMG